jgi:K+-transporting ATPase ATPase C chain
MRNQVFPSILLTLCCLFFFCGSYTLAVLGVAQLASHKGQGEIIQYGVKEKYGYANVGQSFTADKYFWSRPSAVNYNAAGSGGSNKGPSNPEYLAQVKARIDAFLLHNPGVEKAQIPADLVTASGSGLDPDISVASALAQVKRIARVRHLNDKRLIALIADISKLPLMGILGPSKVNVLKLNLELDRMK